MSAPGNQASEFYDDVWDKYAHLDAVSPAAFHRRRIVARLAGEAAPRAVRALDIGCGRGELLRELAGHLPETRLAGADVSERSLELTRRENPNYELFPVDLERRDFADAHREHLDRFDLITCCEVIEHIENHRRAAANLATLLAPGGRLIVTVPGGKMSRFDVIIGHYRHYQPAMLRTLLESSGLEVDRVLAWGFPFHNLYRTAVRVAAKATMGEPKPESAGSDRISGALGSAYSAFGKLLTPLFYLNANRWGEQMIALAKKP